MQPATACPGLQPLQQLLRGQTPEADAARLEQHVADCPSCFQQLAEMAGEKELAQAMQANLTVPHPRHPVLGRLLYKIGRPEVPPLPASLVNTGAVSMTKAGAPLPFDPADETSHFLAPAQGPGELGRLGGYRVLRVLGVGGMGTVYEAEDVTLRRRVALKTMKPAVAAQPGARDRFLREARAAAALNHDHVVPIYQVGEERSLPFLAMPLLHGEMLEDRLKRVGRLPLADALRIGREIAEGLAAAHDHGIVHRDIKPGNVWLERPGDRVKILDFGLASGQEGDVQLTTPGTIMGTPAYMAPEQAGGPIDHRADLFSLGCVLYRAATGRLPFPGSSPMEILRNIAVQTPRSPRKLNPEIPTALDQFLLRLLAKERGQRPVSAAVVAKVLKTLEQQLSATIQTLAGGRGGHPGAGCQAGRAARGPADPGPSQGPRAGGAANPEDAVAGRGDPKGRKRPELLADSQGERPAIVGAGPESAAEVAAVGRRRRRRPAANRPAGADRRHDGVERCAADGRQAGAGRNPNGDPGHPHVDPPTVVPSPPRLEIDVKAGQPLNPNSIVMRPAKIEGLLTWDLISDHVSAISNVALSFTHDGRLDLRYGDAHYLWDFETGGLAAAPFGGNYSAIAPDKSSCARNQQQSVQMFVKDKTELDHSLLTPIVLRTDWSNGGDYLATFGGEGICVWNPNSAQRLNTWSDYTRQMGNADFVWAPDDRSIVLWAVAASTAAITRFTKSTSPRDTACEQLPSKATPTRCACDLPRARRLRSSRNKKAISVFTI